MQNKRPDGIPRLPMCFLIFSYSEETFGEWQMLRWPVSHRHIHQIRFPVTQAGPSPAPPMPIGPVRDQPTGLESKKRTLTAPVVLFKVLWDRARCDSFKPSHMNSGHIDCSSTWHITRIVRMWRVLCALFLIDGLCTNTKVSYPIILHRIMHLKLQSSTVCVYTIYQTPREQAQIDQRKRHGGWKGWTDTKNNSIKN